MKETFEVVWVIFVVVGSFVGLVFGIAGRHVEPEPPPGPDHMFMCITRDDGLLSCRRVEVK